LTILLALVAALLFALGNVLEQRVAMGFPDRLANSALFMVRLARNPVWLLGTAVILIGFGFHAGALASGQIVVVQPILALTLVMALPLGARLSAQRVSRRDVAAAIVVTVALAAFLVLSAPAEGIDDPAGTAWVVASAAVLVPTALLAAAGLHARPGVKAALVGAAAGVVFGLHGALVKAMVARFDDGVLGPLTSWELYAVLAGAVVGMTLSQISLQAGDLPPAIATQSIATPVVGVVLGVTLFEEAIHDTAAGTVASVAALAVMAAGTAALAYRNGGASDSPAAEAQSTRGSG
jgi:drug/metabolite transporter (DMT)-like permease